MIPAYFSLAAAMILVGLNIPVGKMLLAHFPVFVFMVLRGAIGMAVLFPLIRWRSGGVDLPPKAGLGAVVLQAFLGVFLFNLTLLWGLERTSAVSAGIITSTIPAAVALLGFLIFRERMGRRTVMVVALAVAGVLLVNMGGGADDGGDSLLGNTLVVGTVLCEALFIICAKRAASHMTPMTGTAWLNAFAFIMFLPLAIGDLAAFDWLGLSLESWILLVYYALTSSVVCYMLWFFGSGRVPVAQSGLFTALLPVSAVFGGAVFLGEYLSLLHVAGMSLAIVAIFLGIRGSRRPVRADKEKAAT